MRNWHCGNCKQRALVRVPDRGIADRAKKDPSGAVVAAGAAGAAVGAAVGGPLGAVVGGLVGAITGKLASQNRKKGAKKVIVRQASGTRKTAAQTQSEPNKRAVGTGGRR